jgi:hypothetical protein
MLANASEYASKFEEPIVDPALIAAADPNAIDPAQTAEAINSGEQYAGGANRAPASLPWYNNPGFWSQVGGVGSALLSKSPYRSLQGLSAAGGVAANFHQGAQLDLANKRVQANVAAGLDPMQDMTEQETRGLSPEQVSGLSKLGETQRLLQSQLLTGESSRGYTDVLKQRGQQIIDEKNKQEENFSYMIDAVKSGQMKHDIITPENVDLFKSIGSDHAFDLIKEITKQTEIAKRQGDKVSHVNLGDKIMLFNDTKKIPIDTYPVGAKPKDGGNIPDKSWHISTADTEAFRRLSPMLEKAYLASFGTEEQQLAKKSYQDLTNMISDEKKGPGAINAILGKVGPTAYNEFVAHKNEIAASLAKTGQVPSYNPPAEGAKNNTTAPDSTKIPQNKTTGSVEQDAEKYGKWLDTNKDTLVKQLITSKAPAKVYRDKKTGYQFYWDGKGGIELSSEAIKK